MCKACMTDVEDAACMSLLRNTQASVPCGPTVQDWDQSESEHTSERGTAGLSDAKKRIGTL